MTVGSAGGYPRAGATSRFVEPAVCVGGVAAALLAAAALASGRQAAPVLLLIGLFVLGGAVLLWVRPRLSVYAVTSVCLLFEQFPVVGVSVPTSETRLFQTLSGAGLPVPVPMSPFELLLLFSLARLVLGTLVPGAPGLRAGPLLAPQLWLAAALVAAMATGVVLDSGTGPFDLNAAWAEARSLTYMLLVSILTFHHIRRPEHVRMLVRVLTVSLCLKGVLGAYTALQVRSSGISVDAIMGHEDAVFLATFVVLLAALRVYGVERRQQAVMCAFLPAVLLADLANSRRIAWFVLAAGLLVLAVAMLRTHRRLFFRLAPAVLVLAGAYAAVFWNASGLLAQPVAAFRSQFGGGTAQDRASDRWRELENINIENNINADPLTGIGLGRQYRFYVEEPSLDLTGFTYWRYITHNTVFWVWMKMGIFGFTAFWYLFGSAIVLSLVTLRRSADPYHRALAVVVCAQLTMQILFAYGDLGLTWTRPMVITGVLLGLLGSLASDSGLTPTPRAAYRTAEASAS